MTAYVNSNQNATHKLRNCNGRSPAVQVLNVSADLSRLGCGCVVRSSSVSIHAVFQTPEVQIANPWWQLQCVFIWGCQVHMPFHPGNTGGPRALGVCVLALGCEPAAAPVVPLSAVCI